MRVKIVGAVVAVLAIGIQAVEYTISAFVNALQEGGSAAGWFPHLEATGQTAVFYLQASRAITFLLAVPIVAFLGYKAGERLNVAREYPTVIGTFALSGCVGHLFGLGIISLLGGPSILGSVQSPLGFSIVLGTTVATALQFALLGLAGAALAEFGVTPFWRQTDREASNTGVENHSD